MYTIIQDEDVDKFLDKIPNKDYLRISSKILELGQNPYSPHLDVKKITGLEKVYRLRVGNYRVKYRIENEMLLIYIVEVGHRKDVYK